MADKHPRLRAWEERARKFLKLELKRAELTYAQLAERLKEHGFVESEESVTSKLARGTFPASFFLATLEVLGLAGVELADL